MKEVPRSLPINDLQHFHWAYIHKLEAVGSLVHHLLRNSQRASQGLGAQPPRERSPPLPTPCAPINHKSKLITQYVISKLHVSCNM
ncbi:hypothetical protein HanXRQr2_Chr02g0077231 [Helianthus annuus]|uniref:Uncharacterized protein n=1 Tax=Helianthus annuus TaxID=4232 RepID=A0A9K3JQK0_HELAN|nr:hypothetical protein HanXRQr2_Chr02g0077231 [Helianthus annuus]